MGVQSNVSFQQFFDASVQQSVLRCMLAPVRSDRHVCTFKFVSQRNRTRVEIGKGRMCCVLTKACVLEV